MSHSPLEFFRAKARTFSEDLHDDFTRDPLGRSDPLLQHLHLLDPLSKLPTRNNTTLRIPISHTGDFRHFLPPDSFFTDLRTPFPV
jgi:hypothetical protein